MLIVSALIVLLSAGAGIALIGRSNKKDDKEEGKNGGTGTTGSTGATGTIQPASAGGVTVAPQNWSEWYNNIADPAIKDYLMQIDKNDGKVEPATPPNWQPKTIKELCTTWETVGMPGAQEWLNSEVTLNDYRYAQKILIRKNGIKPTKMIDRTGAYVIRNISTSKQYSFSPLSGTTVITTSIMSPDQFIYRDQKIWGELVGMTAWLANALDHSTQAYNDAHTILIDKSSKKRVARSYDVLGIDQAIITNI
ncbi:MAG: hypothetical protein AAF599_00085 [Bacteroidota bacterium]